MNRLVNTADSTTMETLVKILEISANLDMKQLQLAGKMETVLTECVVSLIQDRVFLNITKLAQENNGAERLHLLGFRDSLLLHQSSQLLHLGGH